MFGWMDFREDGRKRERKNIFGRYWLKGEEGKNWWGLGIFSLGPPKCFPPKMGKKLDGKRKLLELMKMPCIGFVPPIASASFFLFFFFPFDFCLCYTTICLFLFHSFFSSSLVFVFSHASILGFFSVYFYSAFFSSICFLCYTTCFSFFFSIPFF